MSYYRQKLSSILVELNPQAMWSSVVLLALLIPLLIVTASPTPTEELISVEKEGIPPSVYNDLVFYFKYASSAYVPFLLCPRPNGNTFVARINSLATDTQGFIARDDVRKEVVISLRGSTSIMDFLKIDANILQKPINLPGVSGPGGVLVHAGFLQAWNSVASSVISTVRQQLASYPGYSIVTTGHSLGGALSSLAAVTMKANFPEVPVRMFTYGQPRTGNSAYASWVNQQFGPGKAFRATHLSDPVPHVPLQTMGYAHHGVEYWISSIPARPSNTRECAASGEDPTCSNSIALLLAFATLPAHLSYFNIPSVTPFCLRV